MRNVKKLSKEEILWDVQFVLGPDITLAMFKEHVLDCGCCFDDEWMDSMGVNWSKRLWVQEMIEFGEL